MGFERSWLEGVLARYEQPLLRFAAQIVGRDRARDVVQDTFLAPCKADRDQIELRLAPWLFVVCRNRALDLLREQRRLSQLDEEAGVTSLENGRSGDGVETRQALGRVQELLEQLPPRERQVLVLRFSAGMSYN